MGSYANEVMSSVNEGFHGFMATLPATYQDQMERLSTQRWADAGKVLIEQDADSDGVFIIEQGVAEVLIETPDVKVPPPLTYLGRGDIVGELGVMNGTLRTATVRASCDVYYRMFEAEVFLDMMVNIPGFAAFIAGRLAKRVSHTTANIAYNSICIDLSGKLPQFDMISVFYTVAGSGSSGELKVVNSERDTIGTFFFLNGTLNNARYLHLQGIEACRQLFIEHWLEGAFSFKRGVEPSEPVDEEYQISIQVQDIVFEGALLRDGLEMLPESLQKLQGMIRVTEFDPETGLGGSLEIRERINEIAGKDPVNIQDAWSRCGVSLVEFGKACLEMQKLGQLEHEV